LWNLLLGGAVGPDQMLDAVCSLATQQCDVDGAAIALHFPDSPVHELAATVGSGAVAVDEAQFVTGEGPAVTALAADEPVLAPDLLEQPVTLWPAFTQMAVHAGIAAVFSFPVTAREQRWGSLDLNRRYRGGLSGGQLADARILAELAGWALSWQGAEITPHLTAGQGHYQRVHLATGMLVAQHRIPPADAAALLRAHAFRHSLSPSTVAQHILERRLHLEPPEQ
jgi:hypothetical protein